MCDKSDIAVVYLSLGSNVGNRAQNLSRAIEELKNHPNCTVRKVSRFYETAPVGNVEQPWFLNVAVEIVTSLEPGQLLDYIKMIERKLGRVQTGKWQPRPIDIDIILWADRIVMTETLTIPHPLFRERAFVLLPLLEIAPEACDPVTGLRVCDLVNLPEMKGEVRVSELTCH